MKKDMLIKRYLNYAEFATWFEQQLEANSDLFVEQQSIHVKSEADIQTSCRIPLILRDENLQTIERLEAQIDEPGCYGIVLMQAGRASLAVGRADEIICSKQIQKYMVRKSQGKSQLNYLNQKGKSRLGSRIRLRQSVEFFAEINQKLSDWNQAYHLQRLFLSCSPKLKGAWFGSSTANPFAKKDPRWRRVPFTVGLPNQQELLRIHYLLCRAAWELLPAESKND